MKRMTISGPAMPLLMPITEVLLAQRVTPAEVRDPASPRAFAFGQYILLRRKSYLVTGGYTAAGIRSPSIDDLALSSQFNQSGHHLQLFNGPALSLNTLCH